MRESKFKIRIKKKKRRKSKGKVGVESNKKLGGRGEGTSEMEEQVGTYR